ncbi:hypothetical protein LUZ60_012657 [Juncus effusus]|nr:hypothetical protein LUZ60_012657 [Juncus effusus]
MASMRADDTDIICSKGTTHQFKINYSKIKDMSIGNYAALFLELLEDHKGLNATFTLGIFEDFGTQEHMVLHEQFNHTIADKVTKPPECSCGVLEDISKTLETGGMTNVKFEVDGKVFSAHKFILGARSPVFKAELYGSMSETRMDCIKIRDMKSEVFKALLHFVYTYSLPYNADTDLIQHFLVAADRYAIEGLITRCEKWLIENIYLGNVLGFLVFAERYNFNKLKDACLEMIVQQKNFNELAITDEYCVMIQEFPYLADLRERIIHS